MIWWLRLVVPTFAAFLQKAADASWFPNGLAPLQIGVPVISAESCATCHRAQHSDWQHSRHGQAWTNPIFQREYRDRPLDWCVHCHAPLAEQLQQIRQGGGALADEGVTCVACHVRQGRMVSRTRASNSPHTTRRDAGFGSPQYCAGCHQFNFPREATVAGQVQVVGYTSLPMQDTVAQHIKGPFAERECLSCHQAGAGGHRFPGGHDPLMVQRALALSACRDRTMVRLSVLNQGAGHHVPTGDVHRHVVLRAWFSEHPEKLAEFNLGRTFEPAPGEGKRERSNTTLAAGHYRDYAVSWTRLGGRRGATLHVQAQLVFTIDEFPFRGRELSEPTSILMFAHDFVWKDLRECESSARTQ